MSVKQAPGNAAEGIRFIFFFHERCTFHFITLIPFGCYVWQVGVLATVSGVSRVDWALIKVNVVLENAMPPTFEHPHGYTFSVKEEEGGGLSVGFVKVFILFSI